MGRKEGRKEGFTARKVVHSDPNKTERNTLKKSASQPAVAPGGEDNKTPERSLL